MAIAVHRVASTMSLIIFKRCRKAGNGCSCDADWPVVLRLSFAMRDEPSPIHYSRRRPMFEKHRHTTSCAHVAAQRAFLSTTADVCLLSHVVSQLTTVAIPVTSTLVTYPGSMQGGRAFVQHETPCTSVVLPFKITKLNMNGRRCEQHRTRCS